MPPKLRREDRDYEDLVRLYLEDVGRHDLLTKDDEIRLAQAIEGGIAATEELNSKKRLTPTQRRALRRKVREGEEAHRQFVNSNLRLVVSIAKKYQSSGLPLLDIVQEGNLGLIHAVDKFDWRKGFKFSTYATWWIRQACQRAIANQSKTIRIPVHVDERRSKLARVRQRFEVANGREPTLEELAEASEMSVHHAREALDAVEASVSLHRPIGDDATELGDLLADPDSADPEAAAGVALRSRAVRRALVTLPERQRRIVELRFGFEGETMSLEAIGRELGITRERVRQLELDALARLAGELDGVVAADSDELADAA